MNFRNDRMAHMVILALVVAAASGCAQKKPGNQEASPTAVTSGKNFSAIVTDTNGQKTTVDSLTWGNSYQCEAAPTVSRSLEIRSKNIRVNTGGIVLTIPFEIISSFHCIQPKGESSNSCTVTLGDGSVIKGAMWGDFTGQGSLGKVEIGFRYDEQLPGFDFSQKAETAYSYAPPGKHPAVVHTRIGTSDPNTYKRTVSPGKVVTLAGAVFEIESKDKLECYTHETYQEEICHSSGGVDYSIGWDKIAALDDSEDMSDGNKSSAVLTMRDGQTRKGLLCKTGYESLGIVGAMSVGNYKLQAEVPLGSWEIAKVEFRN